MASPTIVFNSSTGSDTAASGAGPVVAIAGTAAASRVATTAVQIGFFEADPNLSGVATDSSHVLWIDTPSGRQYSDITAVNNTATSNTTGSITSGTNTLTVASGSGIANGDLISIAGAGAAGATLYTTVTSGGGTVNIVVADNAGTTVAGNAVVRPKQVTVGATYTVAQVGRTWAIGGKRATFDHVDSRTLFVDARSGWIIQTETNQSITVSSLSVTATGFTVRGSTDSPRPIINHTANTHTFIFGSSSVDFYNLQFTNSNATKTNAYAGRMPSSANFRYINCIFGDATNKLISPVLSASGSPALYMQDCEMKYCTSHGLTWSSGIFRVLNCYIHHNTGAGVSASSEAMLDSCIVASNSSHGIQGGSFSGEFDIRNCTVNGNTGDGFRMSGWADNTDRLVCFNNNFTNNTGWGVNANASANGRQLLFNYNNYYNNTSGSISNLPAGANDTAINPDYVDSANGNYTPQATGVKGVGFPGGGTVAIGGGTSGTLSYVDIGVAQHQDAGGSTNIFIISD